MEYIVKELLHPEEDDEARYVYSELDSERKETRRGEFYPGGVCFAYGGDMGHDEVLDPTPFPAKMRSSCTTPTDSRSTSPRRYCTRTVSRLTRRASRSA